MTNQKLTTFLMCPAADGEALGGPPAANAASGGHIKKSAGWVHVFDAASVALVALIAQRKRANDDADVAEGCTQSALVVEAQSGYRSAANEKEPGQCGFHDSVLPKASSNQHHAEGKENDAEGQEVHGGLSAVQRRAALVVATTANWIDRQRLEIVAVVVVDGGAAAVRARERARVGHLTLADGPRHLVVRFALRRAVQVVDRHGSGRLGFGLAVDVVEGQIDAAVFCEYDELLGQLGAERLARFKIRDVALRAAESIGKHLLRDGETLADGFEVVHAPIISGAFGLVNSAADRHE